MKLILCKFLKIHTNYSYSLNLSHVTTNWKTIYAILQARSKHVLNLSSELLSLKQSRITLFNHYVLAKSCYLIWIDNNDISVIADRYSTLVW